MKTFIVIIFSFACSLMSRASDNLVWFEGSVVLSDGNRVITGKISIQAAFDLVMVHYADSMNIYPAHKVVSVRYFDPFTKINRKFTVIPLALRHFKVSRLFEVVIAGDVPVLRRIRSMVSSREDDVLAYDYFIHFNGEVIDLTNFAARVFPSIESIPLKRFIKKEKLSLFVKRDIVVILQHYNKHHSLSRELMPG